MINGLSSVALGSWLKIGVELTGEVLGPGTSSCAEADKATTSMKLRVAGSKYENFALIKIRT